MNSGGLKSEQICDHDLVVNKVCENLGNFDLLRANLLTAAASNTGGGPLVIRHRGKILLRKITAVEVALIRELDQHGNVQFLRTVCGAIATGRAYEGLVLEHVCNNFLQRIPLNARQGLFFGEGMDIVLDLLIVRHAGECNANTGNGL